MNLMNSIAKAPWLAGFKINHFNCANCQRSMILGNRSAEKAGIKIREGWFCSSQCFTAAAEQEISELLTSGQRQANQLPKMSLGHSLVQRGLLTTTQYKRAMDKQREAGGEIDELLMQFGSVTEKQITAVRAMQWGCPVFSVQDYAAQAGVHIPLLVQHLYAAIPLHYVAATKLLLVGFVRRIEYGLLYAIEQITGCKTQACFVTPSDFQTRMEQMELAKEQCGDIAATEEKFDQVQSPAEMARILCSAGIDMEAAEATFGRCNQYVWARLKSDRKEMHLLFRAS